MATERIWLPDGVPTWPVHKLVPAPWNPNSQSGKVFNNLVEAILEHGFLEPIIVAPIPADNAGEYLTQEQIEEGPETFRLIVGGKHRWDAATVLDMSEVPVIFKEDFTEDVVKLQNMRLNMLRGKIDPERFQKLYFELQEKGYEEEILQAQMGLVEESALKGLLKDIKSDLPKEMRDKLEDVEGDIETMDDLDRVLNELMSKHGDTLPYDYIIFDFNGKSVQWVKCDPDMFRTVSDISQFCYDNHLSVNRAYALLFEGAKERIIEAKDALLADADEEMTGMFD